MRAHREMPLVDSKDLLNSLDFTPSFPFAFQLILTHDPQGVLKFKILCLN
jgi:hypothetical protein